MKKVSRSLHLVSASGATRTGTFKGRDYLIVPVVALVEGVIHPINAETPEYVTADSYSLAPEGWNGRPVFPGHPTRGGEQVLGNTPDILESESFGIVFNAGVTDEKLTMEAWLNKDDAESVGESAVEIYDRASSGKPIEISVGATVLMEEVKGTYNDLDYDGKWIEVFPDHLALLPSGDIGACSIAMGCGVRTATLHLVTAKGYELVSRKEEVLPEPKEPATKKRSLLQRLGGLLRMASPATRSDTEVRSELVEALEVKEPRVKYNGWIVDVYENEGLVVYCMYDEAYDMDLYVRDYKWDGKTAIIGDLFAKVEAHTVYEVEDDEDQTNEVLITQLRAAQKVVEQKAAASCGCGGKTTPVAASTIVQGESAMKSREDRIVAMIAASAALIAAGKTAPKYTDADKPWLTQVPDAHFEALESGVKETPAAAPVATPAVVPAVATTEVVAKEKETLTEEQFMAAAPASLKRTLARAQANETARKNFLAGRLKTAQTEYDEAALGKMDIDELERLARMLKVGGPVEAADFSGLPVPRETYAGEGDAAPAPPSYNEKIRAASGKK